jgi:transposase
LWDYALFSAAIWGGISRLGQGLDDAGYGGPKLHGALEQIGDWTVEIIKRSNSAKGFEVLPRRWVVERTFAWLGRCRRLAKDWEKTIASAEAWLLIAHIRLVTRRLARYCYQT